MTSAVLANRGKMSAMSQLCGRLIHALPVSAYWKQRTLISTNWRTRGCESGGGKGLGVMGWSGGGGWEWGRGGGSQDNRNLA